MVFGPEKGALTINDFSGKALMLLVDTSSETVEDLVDQWVSTLLP